MALIRDQRGGHEDAGVGVDAVHASPERQRPYAYTCLNCGTQNVGKVEDGCQTCGAGRGGELRGPEPPVDFTCQACRGNGKVERKCGTCGGSGTIGPGDTANPPQACLSCGGGGSVAMDCARCDGTGIDPHPTPRAPAKPNVVPEYDEAADIEDAMAEKTLPPHRLPSLDDPQPGSPLPVEVRRYLVVELVGSTEVVNYVAAMMLAERERPECRQRAVEIAQSPTTQRLFT